MNHYFAELLLTNMPVILVGGGKVAQRKLQGVLACNARVTVISPQLCPQMIALLQQGHFYHIEEHYENRHLQQTPPPVLVFAATSDSEVNCQIAADCQQRSILCNVVDAPASSTFLVPAMLRRPALTIAIGTGGQSPALARILKEHLDQLLSTGWDDLIKAFGQLRPQVRESLPQQALRERFWQQTAKLTLQEKVYQMEDPATWLAEQWKKHFSSPTQQNLE